MSHSPSSALCNGLKLPPLRQRADEIPLLAEWFGRLYAEKLRMAQPAFSAEAKQRLRNYLWFGNVSEMETVVARTLAFHRKPQIDSSDLIFDFGGDPQAGGLQNLSEAAVAPGVDEPKFEVYRGSGPVPGLSNGQARLAELNVVIHVLAHELKNPMVTIKTFAQLLGERYQDENFRNRFQEVVGNDIERMDNLLEVMIEFADFTRPRSSKVALGDKLRSVLAEIQSQTSRQMRFEWKGSFGADEIHNLQRGGGVYGCGAGVAPLGQARVEIVVSHAGNW